MRSSSSCFRLTERLLQPGVGLSVLAIAAMLSAPPDAWGARRRSTTVTPVTTVTPPVSAPVTTASSTDIDGDGIPNVTDNCSGVANPSQFDSDADGYGNACDPDLDNNGVVNAADATILRDKLGATNFPVGDLNDNGVVNSQDMTILRAWLGKAPGPSGLVADITTYVATDSYSTSFDATENPISEGGAWHRANNPFTNVRTAGGNAFGTNGSADSYDDSYALLSGLGADQTAEAVVFRSPNLVREITHEVELLLRFSDDSQNARGYECLFSYTGGIQIVRWNGEMGDFSVLDATGPQGLGRELVSGDVVSASIVGSVINVYINGELLASATDSTFATGQPGISFFTRPGGNSANFALSSYNVTTK